MLDLVPAQQMALMPAVVQNKYFKERGVGMFQERNGNFRLSKKRILLAVMAIISSSLMAACTQTRAARELSREAQIAMVESLRQFEKNPEDLSAARETLIQYMATNPSDSVPRVMYMRLGQLWYMDEGYEKHIEEANKVYATGSEIYPDDEALHHNYEVTTHKLER